MTISLSMSAKLDSKSLLEYLHFDFIVTDEACFPVGMRVHICDAGVCNASRRRCVVEQDLLRFLHRIVY